MTHAVTTQDERERLRIAVHKQFRIHGGVTDDGLIAELRASRNRIAELERQRDAVLALCDEANVDDDPSDPLKVYISASKIRAIYGGGQ